VGVFGQLPGGRLGGEVAASAASGLRGTMAKSKGKPAEVGRMQSDGLPFSEGQLSETGDFLVKVRRVKVLGFIKFVRRTKRHFIVNKEDATVSYERDRNFWRFRARKRNPTFTVNISDIVTVR
jgi:hypothetical protein